MGVFQRVQSESKSISFFPAIFNVIWHFLVYLLLSEWSFPQKWAIENLQDMVLHLLLAVANGVSVLVAIITVKGVKAIRPGKSSMKFYVLKEEVESKWTLQAANAMNVI